MRWSWVGLLLVWPLWAEELDAAVASRHCQLQFAGDGHSSRRIQLTLKNLGSRPLDLHLARFTTLEHSLLLLEDRTLQLPARATARATLTAMTFAPPEQAAPQETAEEGHPGAPGANPLAVKASQCYQAALKQASSFPDMPITPSQRPLVLAQLAFWRSQGQLDLDGLKALVNRQLKPDGVEAQKEAEEGVAAVWKAIEMVLGP
ncbi:MAG: hypothetical protein U0931_32700 [Vulcanimicrobiota bacterium]